MPTFQHFYRFQMSLSTLTHSAPSPLSASQWPALAGRRRGGGGRGSCSLCHWAVSVLPRRHGDGPGQYSLAAPRHSGCRDRDSDGSESDAPPGQGGSGGPTQAARLRLAMIIIWNLALSNALYDIIYDIIR
jgi:hypothetical protein